MADERPDDGEECYPADLTAHAVVAGLSRAGLTAETIERATGVARGAWDQRRHPSRRLPTLRHHATLFALRDIVDELRAAATPDLDEWLCAPHVGLAGMAPVVLLADGDTLLVSELIPAAVHG